MPNRNNNQIQQGVRTAQTQAGYGVSLVPYHTHDGIDSPRLKGNIVYYGCVNADGTPQFALPAGWSSVYDAGITGYIITHNLGTLNYYYAATADFVIGGSSTVTDGKTANLFKVVLRQGGSAIQISWTFIVVVNQS